MREREGERERLLTACVFKAVDGVGQKADTAQETSSLLLVNLLVIPHTDGDGVRFSNVSKEREKCTKKLNQMK